MAVRARSGDFADVAGFLGAKMAEELCRHLGGTVLYVPAHIGAHHPLAVALGLAQARRFAAEFAGAHLNLPKAYSRYARALELRRTTDMTVRQIAIATDYTENYLYARFAQERMTGEEADGDGEQLDLFAPDTTPGRRAA